MNINHYFPLKHAKGSAFCNRKAERKKLFNEVSACQHLLITAPRRYGKSSLVIDTLTENRVLFERVDLFVAIDEQSMEKAVLQGCKNLLNKILSPTEKALQQIRKYLSNAKLRWVVGLSDIKIEIIPESDSDAINNMLEMLKLIEAMLLKNKQRGVIFIDEFQEVSKLSQSRGIEGAIRHVAEMTEQLCFIFSGSNRHLLKQMFYDRNRPLYNLCERIVLERISEKEYQKFLDRIAIKKWDSPLGEKALHTIFELTERHPSYMNRLCRRVWFDCEKLPTPNKIKAIWNDYVEQERYNVINAIDELSMAQKKLLITIANGKRKELSSKESVKALNLTSGGITSALKNLQEKDFIEWRETSGYHVIDPAIATALKK